MRPTLLATCAFASVASAFNVTDTASGRIRVVVGGGGANSIWREGSEILDPFRGFGTNGVKVITAAGSNPVGDGARLVELMDNAGISAEWIPIYDVNCAESAFDPAMVAMVEEADAIFYGGGQSGRLQSCMYGRYSQSGIDVMEGESSPFLEALIAKDIVGGSSAGAMNQPISEILVTGHSVESYSAVSRGSVFQRNRGNDMLETDQLVDTHFSERGRQGRLMIIAMQTEQKFAFGVDEDAAYIWTPEGTYEVVSEAIRDGVKGGVVVFEDVKGDSSSQSGLLHFLTEGDTINPSTGEIKFNPDKSPCPTTATAPGSSNSIFNGAPSVPYRTISIAMSQGPVGATVSNMHGNPPVEVQFEKTRDTVAMCGASGQSFANLSVAQFQRAFSKSNTEIPDLPQDFMWEVDTL